MERKIRFYKNAKGGWYADFPEWGGNVTDLQIHSTEILKIVYAREENLVDGGDYLLENFKGNRINHKLWFYGVTAFFLSDYQKQSIFKESILVKQMCNLFK